MLRNLFEEFYRTDVKGSSLEEMACENGMDSIEGALYLQYVEELTANLCFNQGSLGEDIARELESGQIQSRTDLLKVLRRMEQNRTSKNPATEWMQLAWDGSVFADPGTFWNRAKSVF